MAQGSLNAGGIGGLNGDFPFMCDHPAGDEVVVVGVEGADAVEEDAFGGECVEEGLGFEDARAVGGGAAGYDEDTAVDAVGCGDFKVVAFEV